MSDERSVVLKPREPFTDAILPENADELAKFMEQPLVAIAECITGAMAAGPKHWMIIGGHLVQSILKAKLFQQLSQEIKELREKGKIPNDFVDDKKYKYGFKSWVELLTVIDEETPDADRLEALKAMFFAVNKTNAADGERIVGYQLFQIAKKLTSGQLLYLNACYDIYQSGDYQKNVQAIPVEQWFQKVGQRLGHQVTALLNQDDLALEGYGLTMPRYHGDKSGLNENDAHLSKLGILFCQNIETYNLETSSTSDIDTED
jgi:hypothetical protein